MPEPPCYNHITHTDCPDRYMMCHSTCLAYKQYEEERMREYKERRITQEREQQKLQYKRINQQRMERRRHKR